MKSVRTFPLALSGLGLFVLATITAGSASAQHNDAKPNSAAKQMTKQFKGAKVNAGVVTHEHKDGKHVLTWSDEFVIPDTPAPHWQVVDSKGNTYLLQRLQIKEDKQNRTITVPGYVPDIAKVQIWCAWAEALLGEAAFETPVK